MACMVVDEWCGSNGLFCPPPYFPSLIFGKVHKLPFICFFIQCDHNSFDFHLFCFFFLLQVFFSISFLSFDLIYFFISDLVLIFFIVVYFIIILFLIQFYFQFHFSILRIAIQYKFDGCCLDPICLTPNGLVFFE